jgi:hypothetical protein
VLADATTATAALRCTTDGVVTATLAVSDGDFGCQDGSTQISVACGETNPDLDAGASSDRDD